MLLLVLGFLEGLEVSVLTIQLASPELWKDVYHGRYDRAAAVHALTSGKKASNILAFVLGRQILVTAVVFALSLFTQYSDMIYFPWTNSPIAEGGMIFVQQGLVSVVVIATMGE